MIYDKFQIKAIEYINDGYSVIVCAPTGAGKTVIAEHVIQDCLEKGKKVIYTAPIKALSNQKYRDFSSKYPDKVGILTGDISINPQAPALIMTTEIFRNKILEEKSSLTEYAWIIFDEIHFLDDYERGSVWEESLIFLPEHMNMLGLSATIPNIDELVQWLESIHNKPIKVVEETTRPVPLHFYYQCQGAIYDDLPALQSQIYDKNEFSRFQGKRIPMHVPIKSNKPAPLIKYLFEKDMLPCIYFVFSRKRTEHLAQELAGLNFLNKDERNKLLALFEQLLERYDLTSDSRAYELKQFVEKGIAYHHAGMLPTLKEVVEQLFTSRLIKVIFTTETFALGINMPARTVILDELRKFYGYSFAALKTRDFYQMAGRSGRRSIDTEGNVFSRINPHDTSYSELCKIILSKPERVNSRFDASYATILNLYQKYKEKLYDVYPLSFHYFQEKKFARVRALGILRAKVKLLKELKFIHKNNLTKKGEFAGRVYGYELLLAELFERGILEKLSAKELGVLCLAIVFEPRKINKKPKLNWLAKNLEKITQEVLSDIHRKEKKEGLRALSKQCFYHLSACLEEWLKGSSFEVILQYSDTDEGEIVRYFRMCIQIMREILEAPISDQLRSKVYELIRLINRDVVDSEKQLRS